MTGKRKEPASEVTGREKKKQKTALARTIAVQPVPGTSQNAAAGPSKSVRFDSAQALPGSLDVEKFAEARAFEINAMHNAMESARADTTHRAWQQLPRHLRRRAASHDVRRVPLRLRDKARAEMDAPKPKNKHVSKRGKAKRQSRSAELLKRQKTKVWLETHLWHAKRMHMENMWGYRLALQPTEKSFRPSHRASVHGSILHDASYLSLIELRGPEAILAAIFKSCCDCQAPSPAAKRFSNGARACDTHLYKRNSYPTNLIAPIRVLWRALPPHCLDTEEDSSKTSQAESGSNAKAKGEAKGKGKGKAKGKGKGKVPIPDHGNTRTVWIWVHPTMYHEVTRELRLSIAFALEAVRDENISDEPSATVEIADLRDQVNVFEITGPKASQVIRGVFKPVSEDNRTEFKKCWQALIDLQSTASVPRNTVIGMKVHDPRLTFPPHNAQVFVDSKVSPSLSSSTMSFFPTSNLAQCEIWQSQVRDGLKKPQYKKKDLDARRKELLIPGTALQAQRNDDRIPCLLIQRSVENSLSQTPHSEFSGSPSLHGWTLIFPAGWGMAFLSSLIHTGTRVGGQRERQTQSFESSSPFFPRDFPSTIAYDEYADNRATDEEEQWQKKPKAKRPGWERLGVRSPWKPDWEVVLGLKKPKPFSERIEVDVAFVPAMREPGVPDHGAGDPQAAGLTNTTPMDEDRDSEDGNPATADRQQADDDSETNAPRPWLFRGQGVAEFVLSLAAPTCPAPRRPESLSEFINSWRTKRGLQPHYTDEDEVHVTPDGLYRAALVRVAVRMCGRGSPSDMAIIHSMSDEELARFNRTRASRKGPNYVDHDMDIDEEIEQSVVVPTQETIIGYITTGSYSLSLGEGSAIGAIPLSTAVDLLMQGKRLGTSEMVVQVRDRHEVVCREARLLIVED